MKELGTRKPREARKSLEAKFRTMMTQEGIFRRRINPPSIMLSVSLAILHRTITVRYRERNRLRRLCRWKKIKGRNPKVKCSLCLSPQEQIRGLSNSMANLRRDALRTRSSTSLSTTTSKRTSAAATRSRSSRANCRTQRWPSATTRSHPPDTD